MEQETILKEILSTLKEHGERTDNKLVEMKEELVREINLTEEKLEKKIQQTEERLEKKMDTGFASVNERFNQLGKKLDGTRVELSEVQETTDFLLSKVANHEKKLRNIT